MIVVHLLQGSTLHGIKLHKKLWKCSQRRLEGDNLEGGVLFNKFKVLVSCTSIREKFGWVNQSASNSLTLRSSKKKKKKKKDPSSDKESDESFPDDETACDDSHSIFGMRDSFYPQKIFPTSENHCLLQ